VTIREREPIANGLRRQFNAASAKAWYETGQHFDDEMVQDRFTPEHAARANYAKRKGQNLPVGSKGFRRSYYGRKYYASDRGGGANRADPLTNTGATKRAVLAGGRVQSTRHGAKIFYAAARVFNLRNPRSRIRMNDEFRMITRPEVEELARRYDTTLDRHLK
jgi:hypothetical protein